MYVHTCSHDCRRMHGVHMCLMCGGSAWALVFPGKLTGIYLHVVTYLHTCALCVCVCLRVIVYARMPWPMILECSHVYVYMHTYARCVHICGVRAGHVCTHLYLSPQKVSQVCVCLYMHCTSFVLMYCESHDYAKHRHTWVSHASCAGVSLRGSNMDGNPSNGSVTCVYYFPALRLRETSRTGLPFVGVYTWTPQQSVCCSVLLCIERQRACFYYSQCVAVCCCVLQRVCYFWFCTVQVQCVCCSVLLCIARQTASFYYTIIQTYFVELHSRRHPTPWSSMQAQDLPDQSEIIFDLSFGFSQCLLVFSNTQHYLSFGSIVCCSVSDQLCVAACLLLLFGAARTCLT